MDSEYRRTRVLVIDDDAGVRGLLREFLESLGWAADEAPSGEEGLARLDRAAYDLVVTDLLMPGLSGWDVSEGVRRHDPTLPVLMVTGSATNLDVDRARELGVTILHKPIGLRDFRAVVQELLRARAGGAR